MADIVKTLDGLEELMDRLKFYKHPEEAQTVQDAIEMLRSSKTYSLTSINLNDKIKVKLTASGIKRYVDFMNETNETVPGAISNTSMIPKIDEDGYTTFQLYYFMQIFGRSFVMGHDPDRQPIMPLDIILVKEEQK